MKVNLSLYSILIRNGYKLPNKWNMKKARNDINLFIKSQIELTDEFKENMALYTDEQWEKLIWRLHENNHRRL